MATASRDAPITRYPARTGHPETIRINPGGHYVTRVGGELIVTILGSCVAACIRDSVAEVGGMNHFMLPESESGNWGFASASMRFGNFAMERLINDILRRGGRRQNLEIKVFGGASMIGYGAQIGARNADFVETYLREEGLRVAAASLRGNHARRVEYRPRTGQVRMLEMPCGESLIVKVEQSYRASLKTAPACGSVELFD